MWDETVIHYYLIVAVPTRRTPIYELDKSKTCGRTFWYVGIVAVAGISDGAKQNVYCVRA